MSDTSGHATGHIGGSTRSFVTVEPASSIRPSVQRHSRCELRTGTLREPSRIDSAIPADHRLAGQFEKQTIDCLHSRAQRRSVHYPGTLDAKDDAPDAIAIVILASTGEGIREVPFE
jgi:hypothetical protein